MEIAIYIVLVIFLLVVAASLAWLMWLLAAKWLPSKCVMPPNRMAFASVVLSLVTATLFNLELESGALSAPIFVLVFSVLWSAFLIPTSALTKYFGGIKRA
ncbi:hypothetical protein [Rheinheimera nanhaiensis]|uniref:hypothetical protein n=1 Tax=Rheinheimera nanhaiensis TaxID=1163621 RepID=UPI0011D1AC75|nr:hypothetical protein [Rheinheimera nanhaiensis]